MYETLTLLTADRVWNLDNNIKSFTPETKLYFLSI